jgi:hypothetical protein
LHASTDKFEELINNRSINVIWFILVLLNILYRTLYHRDLQISQLKILDYIIVYFVEVRNILKYIYNCLY